MRNSGVVLQSERATVQLDSIDREYPGSPPVRAVRNATLTIERGEYVALTGPSGSGKSTLVNILALLDRPTNGSYRLNGRNIEHLSDAARAGIRSRQIGIVFQDFQLLPHRTAVENVALGLLYQGVRASARRVRACDVLKQVGLADRLESLPAKLSGGERQRVAIARALVGEPAVLLCDEPTGNLDSQAANSILSLLDHLHDGGSTVLVVTHDASVADRAHRRIHMRDGCLFEDPPALTRSRQVGAREWSVGRVES